MILRFNLLTVSGALTVFFDKETRCIRFDSEGKSMALNGHAFNSLISEETGLFTGIDTDIGEVKEFLMDISKGAFWGTYIVGDSGENITNVDGGDPPPTLNNNPSNPAVEINTRNYGVRRK
jgi:hypothetical protein